MNPAEVNELGQVLGLLALTVAAVVLAGLSAVLSPTARGRRRARRARARTHGPVLRGLIPEQRVGGVDVPRPRGTVGGRG